MAANPGNAHLGNIDLKQIQAFLTVVESGGFAAAQAMLNVSPSRLSTLISDLERRLGMRLCQRGRVGFRLTERGEEVYRAAQRLVTGLDAFRSDVSALAGRLVGNLAIGMVDNIISNPANHLPKVMNRYGERAREVHITMHIDAPQELERKVLDGRLDLAIGAFHHTLPGIAYRALFLEEQTLYCGAANALFGRAAEAISNEDILAAPYAGRGYMEDKRPLRFSASASSYSMEGLALMILSGRFIAYLPSHYAAPWVARGEMQPIRPRRLSYQSLFEVAVKKGAPQTPALQAFLEDLYAAHAGPKKMRK
jgi:DNA-binding transcriptional LysR family regulator